MGGGDSAAPPDTTSPLPINSILPRDQRLLGRDKTSWMS